MTNASLVTETSRIVTTRSRVSQRLWRYSKVLVAPVVGLIVAIILIQSGGFQGIPTILVGLEYALGGLQPIARTLAWALPMLVASLGVAVVFRAGLFSLGAQGQIYTGALAGAMSGAVIGGLAPVAHQLLSIVIAAVISAAFSFGLGWLHTRWKVDIILASLMSNYILVSVCNFFANGPFNDPAAEAPGASLQAVPSAMFQNIMPRTDMTTALFVVIVLCAAVWWLMERSVLGYRWRMVGEAPGFAATTGMNVPRLQNLAMAVSGGLCGIAGALLVLAGQGRFTSDIAVEFGWIAVMLALMAKARPLYAVLWVLVYSTMQGASRKIEQVAEVPSELAVLVICCILVASAATPGGYRWIASMWRRRRGMD